MARLALFGCVFLVCVLPASPIAQPGIGGCPNLPAHGALRTALAAAQAQTNGGLGFHMWGTLVDRDGVVCMVAFTGTDRGDQWPGSRVISAQKANTANAFSLPSSRCPRRTCFTAVQPGGSPLRPAGVQPRRSRRAYGGTAG